MADFIEVADRVRVARYEWLDVNVTAVGSDRGLMVVDTHSSGNSAFRSAYGDIVIHAHENAAASTLASGERIKGVYRDDRVVQLVHPGRGHTDGDIVVRVPDVDVVLAGDLVEESAAACPSTRRSRSATSRSPPTVWPTRYSAATSNCRHPLGEPLNHRGTLVARGSDGDAVLSARGQAGWSLALL